ncbi:MarR family winged helix-turn-helix transcriptional regulator [Saccharospirillum alexandrii]|mgnify:FL=1|uniref:MarR family winged helix-turn-helix transcriptional regulator n=1 Tax=Saccharospirillum alexandrii TaxID=2448477 RepID=UPI000FD8A6D0|nr:MarR family winged helix-turn-helix transcriptional regulator [Saccharospirillum alexandrii]
MTDTPDISTLPYNGQLELDYLARDLPFLSRVLRTYIRNETADAYKELNVEPGEIAITNLIGINPGISQNDLAAAVVFKKPAVTKVVRSMEDKGLVKRERVKADKRYNALVLTQEGEKRRAAMRHQMETQHETLLNIFSTEEQAQFFDMMNRLCAHLAERHQSTDSTANP